MYIRSILPNIFKKIYSKARGNMPYIEKGNKMAKRSIKVNDEELKLGSIFELYGDVPRGHRGVGIVPLVFMVAAISERHDGTTRIYLLSLGADEGSHVVLDSTEDNFVIRHRGRETEISKKSVPSLFSNIHDRSVYAGKIELYENQFEVSTDALSGWKFSSLNMRMTDLREWPWRALKIWAINHVRISPRAFEEVKRGDKDIAVDYLVKTHIASAHEDKLKKERLKEEKKLKAVKKSAEPFTITTDGTTGFGGISTSNVNITAASSSNSAEHYVMTGHIFPNRIGTMSNLVSINFKANEVCGDQIRCHTRENFSMRDFPANTIIKVEGHAIFIVADLNDPLEPSVATTKLEITSDISYLRMLVYNYTSDIHHEIEYRIVEEPVEYAEPEVATQSSDPIEYPEVAADTAPAMANTIQEYISNNNIAIGYPAEHTASNEATVTMGDAEPTVVQVDMENLENTVVQSLTQEDEGTDEIDESDEYSELDEEEVPDE